MPIVPFSTTPQHVDLGQLVRPFGSVLNSPTRGRPGENAADTSSTTAPTLVSISWTARAPVQVTDLPSLFVILPNDADDKDGLNGEINRSFHVTRISQDGNPDNWIDVQVPDDITFKNNANQKRKYTFAP